jgi:hypothetical protein
LCGSSNTPYQLPELEENQEAKNSIDTAKAVKRLLEATTTISMGRGK